jgi:hypothetical protein
VKRLPRKLWRIEVVWVDSQLHRGGWQPISGHRRVLDKSMVCHSVGFILRDDKKGITLASSVSDRNSTAYGVISIPARQIVKRRRLR